MKSLAAVALALLSVAVSARPLNANDTLALPEGFDLISREEILKRLGEGAAHSIQKRTAGGVRGTQLLPSEEFQS